jgi:hypothetical protein
VVGSPKRLTDSTILQRPSRDSQIRRRAAQVTSTLARRENSRPLSLPIVVLPELLVPCCVKLLGVPKHDQHHLLKANLRRTMIPCGGRFEEHGGPLDEKPADRRRAGRRHPAGNVANVAVEWHLPLLATPAIPQAKGLCIMSG